MATTTLTPARALRARRRLDGRALLGVIVLLVATAGMLAAWHSADHSVAVLVATKDLPAGSTLQPADLTVTHLQAGSLVEQAALPATEQDHLAGAPLAEPVHAGQVLVSGQLAPATALGPDQVAFTIPLGQDSVITGIHPGDQVRVYVTLDQGKPDSKTVVVVDRARVLHVAATPQLELGSSATSSAQAAIPLRALTLSVGNDDAERLAQARWNGDLDVAVLPPRPAAGQ